MCVCVCLYFQAHPTLHVGSTTLGSQFSPVGLRDQTQVVRLGGKLLYLLSHLAGPFYVLWQFWGWNLEPRAV